MNPSDGRYKSLVGSTAVTPLFYAEVPIDLRSKGITNRVDAWGREWDHEWPTWGRMLPQYLDELC